MRERRWGPARHEAFLSSTRPMGAPAKTCCRNQSKGVPKFHHIRRFRRICGSSGPGALALMWATRRRVSVLGSPGDPLRTLTQAPVLQQIFGRPKKGSRENHRGHWPIVGNRLKKAGRAALGNPSRFPPSFVLHTTNHQNQNLKASYRFFKPHNNHTQTHLSLVMASPPQPTSITATERRPSPR